MPAGSLDNVQDCDDFTCGSTILGIGGGGDPEVGRRALYAALKEGIELRWVDRDDVADDAWTVTAYGSGSIAPTDADLDARAAELGVTPDLAERELQVSFRELEQYLGVKFDVMVPNEIGGENTALPIVDALRYGLRVVDGDYAGGRSVPADTQTAPFLHGIDVHPAVCTDMWGSVTLIKNAPNVAMAERMQKLLSVAALGEVKVAATVLPGAEMKRILEAGHLTAALELGRAVRGAREAGADPVRAILDRVGGVHLFSGTVADKEWAEIDGTMRGTVTVTGDDAWAGRRLRFWFMNENQVTWLDDQPVVLAPDMLLVVDPRTGEAVTNTDIAAGMPVTAIAVAGPRSFRSERGLSGGGPRAFGFDLDYVPVEELLADLFAAAGLDESR